MCVSMGICGCGVGSVANRQRVCEMDKRKLNHFIVSGRRGTICGKGKYVTALAYLVECDECKALMCDCFKDEESGLPAEHCPICGSSGIKPTLLSDKEDA